LHPLMRDRRFPDADRGPVENRALDRHRLRRSAAESRPFLSRLRSRFGLGRGGGSDSDWEGSGAGWSFTRKSPVAVQKLPHRRLSLITILIFSGIGHTIREEIDRSVLRYN
jgi:hypothetical protein